MVKIMLKFTDIQLKITESNINAQMILEILSGYNLTRVQLANILNVSPMTITNWIKRNLKPKKREIIETIWSMYKHLKFNPKNGV